jgi:hypothetical protein
MSWVKIDDQFADHPKIAQAGPLGLAVYVAGLCYSARYLTDGFIPTASAERFAGTSPELRAKLVDLSLWDETDGGYLIHDYLDYNPPAAKVKAEREAAKARMGQKRGKRQQFTGSSGEVQPNNSGSLGEVQPSRTRTPVKEEDSAAQPEVRAISNAYDASGIMLSPAHQEAHLETIKRCGLTAWKSGWAAAMAAGKENIPKYVTRCAESAMLDAQKQQQRNGNGKSPEVPAADF